MALVVSTSYLLWRLTTLGTGLTLVLSLVLFLTELWAFAELGLLSAVAWPHPDAEDPIADSAPGTVPLVDIAVVAVGATPAALERTLIGTQVLDCSGRTIVLDTEDRPELRETAQRFQAEYRLVSDTTAAGIHSATNSPVYLWLEAGQVVMPNLLLATAARFDDQKVATLQIAVGLINETSLVQLEGRRDAAALDREVIGPCGDVNGNAPWHGAGSLVRRTAIERIGGFGPNDRLAVPRAQVRLQQAGLSTKYEPRELLRGIAPASLSAYLASRNAAAMQTFGLLRTDENPLRAKRLERGQRLSHLWELSSYTRGIRQLIQVAILCVAILSGVTPFAASAQSMIVAWLVVLALRTSAFHALGRGALGLGDWVRNAWRTTGADIAALANTFVRRKQPTEIQADSSGLAALRQLGTLTAVMVALDLALLARAWTLIDEDALPVLGGWDRIALIGLGIVTLIPMVDVLQMVVLRKERRTNLRLVTSLPCKLGDNETRTVDISPGGAGLLLDAAPSIGTSAHFALTVPGLEGGTKEISGLCVVRSANRDDSGRVRVGLQFQHLSPEARILLVGYCTIGSTVEFVDRTPVITEPQHFEAKVSNRHRSTVRAVTAAAILAGLAVLFVGPGAASARADEAAPLTTVCVVSDAGDPIADAPVSRVVGAESTLIGQTAQTGCIAVTDVPGTTSYTATIEGIEATADIESATGGVLQITSSGPTVSVLSGGEDTVAFNVRLFNGEWSEQVASIDGVVAVPVNSGTTQIEVTYGGQRIVLPLDGNVQVQLALLTADEGSTITDLNFGDGWEPFVAPGLVLPGFLAVRLADGQIVKVDVPAGHELLLPSGTLRQRSTFATASNPTATATNQSAAQDVELEDPTSTEPEPGSSSSPADPSATATADEQSDPAADTSRESDDVGGGDQADDPETGGQDDTAENPQEADTTDSKVSPPTVTPEAQAEATVEPATTPAEPTDPSPAEEPS